MCIRDSTETVSDLLEVLLLLKETGLMRGELHEHAVTDLILSLIHI